VTNIEVGSRPVGVAQILAHDLLSGLPEVFEAQRLDLDCRDD